MKVDKPQRIIPYCDYDGLATNTPTVETITLCGINVDANPLRPLDVEEVKRLASSMKRIGLMTPITVRYHPDIAASDGSIDSYEIVAGRHRVAAAALLGWERIDSIEIKCSDIDAKLWEISENLHRAELTKLQRDEQVAMWIKLTDEKSDAAQLAPHKKAGQQPGGINAAARDLGVERTDAQRAIKVASLSDEAKAAAIKHGLDDNRSALLEAAKETEPGKQVAKIKERAGKPKSAPTPSIEDDVVGVDAPRIWCILPQEVETFLEGHRQVHLVGKPTRWVTLGTLKAAVLAGKTTGWFVADYNVVTGEFLSFRCAHCMVAALDEEPAHKSAMKSAADRAETKSTRSMENTVVQSAADRAEAKSRARA